MKENVLLEKTFTFAIRVVKAYRYLAEEKKEFVLSKQFLRSGTSIGANAEESVGGQSKADFIQKLALLTKRREKLGIGSDFCRRQIIWTKHRRKVC